MHTENAAEILLGIQICPAEGTQYYGIEVIQYVFAIVPDDLIVSLN